MLLVYFLIYLLKKSESCVGVQKNISKISLNAQLRNNKKKKRMEIRKKKTIKPIKLMMNKPIAKKMNSKIKNFQMSKIKSKETILIKKIILVKILKYI